MSTRSRSFTIDNSAITPITVTDTVTVNVNEIVPWRWYGMSDYISRQALIDRLKENAPDPEWCRDNLHVEPKTYIHNDELADFWLMSMAKHNIIANSTYSFWAAYLNDNAEKIVIYPRNWNIDIQHPVDCLDWRGV